MEGDDLSEYKYCQSLLYREWEGLPAGAPDTSIIIIIIDEIMLFFFLFLSQKVESERLANDLAIQQQQNQHLKEQLLGTTEGSSLTVSKHTLTIIKPHYNITILSFWFA